ncbi:MAG TPA: hypothetical protein VJ748_11095 [Vitreimonas sp.]|jgi:hypothetical protein|nr:hypothetical protein [Vitreimonas sp.]
MRTAAILAGLVALSGCVSTPGEPPSWFNEAGAEAEGGYPSLRDVPRTTTANTDPDYWAAVEADLIQAREELQNHPRAEPAPPEGADEFVNQAREELEESREAHPD